MSRVRVSAHYRITIPPQIREQLGIIPGDEVEVAVVGDSIRLSPVRRVPTLDELIGILPELKQEGVREKEDRL